MKTFGEKGTAGRNIIIKATCPFCDMPLDRPTELGTRRPGEMPVGSCGGCGAVYSFDATGHNLGAAFIEALVFSCNMDWDLAWNLFPEEDYLEVLIENYDPESNMVIPGGFYEGRKIPGVLSFIKLQQDIQEATSQGIRNKLGRAAGYAPAKAPAGENITRKYTKKEIEEAVAEYNVELLIKAAGQDKKVIRILQRLLCSDDLTRLRAAEFLGRASAVIALKEPGTITVLLQNLFNSLADTGSASWGALDAIGEIIGGSPDVFIGYMPALYHFLEQPDKRPQVVKALARIAETRPDLVYKTIFRLLPYLQDPNAGTRGYTAMVCGKLCAAEAREYLEKLIDDRVVLKAYINGRLVNTTVGSLASEALEKINSKNGVPGRKTGDRT